MKKCCYCDFYSETETFRVPAYVNALKKEIRLRSDHSFSIDTLYFGGGTPSLLTITHLGGILNLISKCFFLSSAAEITVEVNPGTVNQEYLKALYQSGVNRLSVGVQSFQRSKLTFLERMHTNRESVQAIENAKMAGFGNLSIDLIYGIPKESIKEWEMDLQKAVSFHPSHLSCYMLTREKDTSLDARIRKGMVVPKNMKDLSSMFEQTSLFLKSKGYDQYEISNFSKGYENRSAHNSKYWDMMPYFGFGPSAHSFVNNVRSWNVSDLSRYIEIINSGERPVVDKEVLTENQKMLEMIMLKLRTAEGVKLPDFENHFNTRFAAKFQPLADTMVNEGLACMNADRFTLTLQGRMKLNHIVEAFADQIM